MGGMSQPSSPDDETPVRKCNLLGVGISVTTYAQTCEAVRRASRARRPLTVTALAVHGVMTGALDDAHCRRLNTLDLVVPDGMPVKWGINIAEGAGLVDRVRGPTLMLRVCQMAERENFSVAFYGSRADGLVRLRDELVARIPGLRVTALMPSRFRRVSPAEQREVAREIVASGADILFVGLGCPRQEVWLYENAALLNMPAIAVGAAFDFHAGLMPEAPAWMQKRGLEWMFRLSREPRRLWRRYMILNPLFLCLLALQTLRLYRRHGTHGDVVIGHVGYA